MANNRSVIEVLGLERWEALKAKGAIMVSLGEKISNGKPTGRQAIIVGVPEKLPLSQLRKQDLIPGELQGMATDVVEFHHGGFHRASFGQIDGRRSLPCLSLIVA